MSALKKLSKASLRKYFYMAQILVVLIVPLSTACQDGTENPKTDCETLHLKDYSRCKTGIGFGLDQLNKATHEIITKEFERVSSTAFFMSLIWKSPDEFDFSGTDKAIAFAKENNMDVHAHCLLYHHTSISPDFLMNYKGDNAGFENLVQTFITRVVSRYKGKVKSYDLTNEIFNYNSSQTNDTWLRQRFDSDTAFLSFIKRCFVYANNADPGALLFYNDYGQEFSNDSYDKGYKIMDMLKEWKASGVPVHGYGLQMHTNIYRPLKDIEKAFSMAVQTGLLIHVSELDVSVNWADFDINGVKGGEQNITSLNEDLAERQKLQFMQVADAYVRIVPREQQYGITVWDTGDKDSWLSWERFERGTLYDENYKRKPAFYGFLEGLSGTKPDCN